MSLKLIKLTLLVVFSSIFSPALAQMPVGLGNSGLSQTSSVFDMNGQLLIPADGGAKVIQPNEQIVLTIEDRSNLYQDRAFGLATDVRTTRSANVINLPGERVSTLAISNSYSIIVDPFTSTPHSFQQQLLLGPISIPVLGSSESIWSQALVLDPSYPNGMAFSNAVRFDSPPALIPSALSASTPQSYSFFGDSVWSEDLNMDGSKDLIIGATRNSSLGVNHSGAVYIRFGPNYLVEQKINPPELQSCSGQSPCSEFGREVSVADITGDGVNDLIVSARGLTVNTKTRAGAVYVIPGPNFDPNTAIKIQEPAHTGGPDVSAWFGQIARPLDWNGDNNTDLLITARKGKSVLLDPPHNIQDEAGEAWVILGPITSSSIPTANIIHIRHMNNSTAPQFGYGASTGDLNKDGRDDVIIGAFRFDQTPQNDDNTGAVFAFISPTTQNSSITSADFVIQPSLDEAAYYGHELVVEDFNNDGNLDIAYAGEFGDSAGLNAGTVRVAFGPKFSQNELVISPSAPRLGSPGGPFTGAPGGLLGGGFGSDLSSCDINGDGFQDLVIGEFYANRNSNPRSGAAWVHLGPSFIQALELHSDHLQVDGYDGRRVSCISNPSGFDTAVVSSPYTINGTGRVRLYNW